MDAWMKGWLDEIMHGRMDKFLDEWMVGIGGLMKVWMGEWTDGRNGWIVG